MRRSFVLLLLLLLLLLCWCTVCFGTPQAPVRKAPAAPAVDARDAGALVLLRNSLHVGQWPGDEEPNCEWTGEKQRGKK
jgi:hypothetical protein